MSDLERVVVALLFGVVVGALGAAASLSAHMQHVWPGALVGGSTAALGALVTFSRRRR